MYRLWFIESRDVVFIVGGCVVMRLFVLMLVWVLRGFIICAFWVLRVYVWWMVFIFVCLGGFPGGLVKVAFYCCG